ncbi:MAG: SatD family protein [Microlunatus sp.]|nr:SatD family protein [Microlunatus sp.]MDN5770282.1 SatD family protein [Microlunatus sp.]
MPYVLTVDQISSRRRKDHVPATMATMTGLFPDVPLTRTVGDEFQALFSSDPMSVVDAILTLMREGNWHVGVGIGTVAEPTPHDLREARGPAFVVARRAVEEAKDRTDHLRVIAVPPAQDEGQDAEVLLGLVLALRSRRSPAGWAATDLSDNGLTQAEIGDQLGVSRQAVNQRLQTARWSLDVEARPVAARLLARAERIATVDKQAS